MLFGIFLTHHRAGKLPTHNNALCGHLSYTAMPILRQHIPGVGSHAISKNLATETAMIHHAF